MALDLEEQEQLAELKAWWKANGKYVITAVSVFVIGVAGWRGWQVWTARQANEASVLFERTMQAAQNNDAKGIKELTSQIMENHGRTGYAAPAAWLAGKTNFMTGDLKSAEAQYQYALAHAREPGLEQLARLRLASVLLDLKRYDEAAKLLDGGHDEAFAALFANLKGDLLLAQGKSEEARAAYKLALEKLDADSRLKPLLEIKLDGVGS